MSASLFLYANDPVTFVRKVLGFELDPVQARMLNPLVSYGLTCCCRGWGKTETTALSTVHHSLTRENALTLVVSETAEKAAELVQRAVQHCRKIGIEPRADGLRRNGWRLPNGSRILPVPQRDGAVRGYPATKILGDEAARINDKIWMALMGTRASTSQQCSVWAMSTPGPRSGFFHDDWHGTDSTIERIWVPATDCARIQPKYIADMRRRLSPADFQREVMAQWTDGLAQLFRAEDVQRAVTSSFKALSYDQPAWFSFVGDDVLLANGRRTPRHGFYVAVDLGQARDFSTIAVLEFLWQPTGRVDALTRHHYFELKLRLRWLSRLELHTPYPDVAAFVGKVMEHPELQGRATAVVDATGNRAFLDLLKSMRLRVQGVQITSGLVASRSPDGIVNLPKNDLMVNIEALLRLGDLQIAADVPLLGELRREMDRCERLVTPSGRITYSGKAHGSDDLLMAVALGVGWAWERHRAGFNLAGRLRSDLEVA